MDNPHALPTPELFTTFHLTAFLLAAAAEGQVQAPRMIGEELDAGVPIQEILKPGSEADPMHLVYKVKRLAPRTYRITLGYEGLAGDGGTWRVVFTAKGAVQRLVAEEFWRC